MNYERGFPLPHYINPELESWIPDVNGIGPDLDSWIPVGNGPVGHRDSWTPIGQENGTRIMQNVENGNPIIPSNMYSQGNENQNGNGNENQNGNGSSSWAPMTPGKPIPTRSNTVTNGNELETENWGDLLGIYQDFLQKKTLNLNEVAQDQYQNNENRIRVSSIAKRNLNPILNSTPVPNLNPKPNHDSRSVSCFPSEDPSNWDGNLLAAIVRPVLGSGSGPIVNGPQNNSVHDLSRTPVVPNQQSHITGGYNSKQLPSDGFPVPYRPCYNLNSPPRSELDVASSDITGPTQFTPITPESKQKSTESQWVPANNEQESQRIEESTSSAVSPQKEQLVTKEGDDELGIDLNKTPNQKTPARRKKHRPKVIREGKKKKTATPKEPKTATPKEPKTATPNDTPVKRKYVRKNQQENGVEIEKSPKVKRKYVRKTPVDQSNSQQETRMEKPAPQIVETPTKSCKRQLNFDLECVAGNESQTKVNPSINLNDNPRDIEQERRINNILERSAMKVAQNNMYTGVTARMQNEPDELNVASNRGHALNMLARNLSMRNTGSGQPVWRNGYNQVSQQEPKGHIVNFDDRRGVKRPSLDQINPRHLNSMDNIYMYQKLLLGGDGARSNELTRIAESQKRTKMQNDVFTPRPDSVYGNISALQFLNSCTGRVNPSYQVNGRHSQPSMVAAQSFQKLPESSRMQQLIERTQRSNQGYGVQSMTAMVSWNRPPATPPKDYGRSAVVPYPTTPVDKKTRTPYSNSQRSNGTNKTMLQLQKEGLEAHQISFRKPRGAPRKPKGGVMVSVEDLTCMLEQLCIDKDKNALVPYKGSNNAIIPFEPIKRRKQRPKVDLDPESDRLWRLLMGKEGSEGDEKLDKDKEKWWENERRVFRGRAESFIARMHLVQGDRRFSRWKGSVVDSVIGVFLTQNVSDHLSSSAFMALAAKFAFKSTTTNKTHSTHGACVLVEQPIEIIRQPVFNQNSFTSLTKLKTTSEEVILSQDSLDSSTIQTVDEIRSSSGSNSEAEDQNLGFETSKKPAEKVSMFKELFSQENRTQQYMHHLPKTSTQIPAINGLNNMTAGFQMPPQDRQYDFLSGVDHQPPVKQKQDSGSEDRVSSVNNKQNSVEASSNGQNYGSHDPVNGPGPEKRTPKGKKVNVEDEKFDWDSLRRDVFMKCEKSERSEDAKDSLDYEALRRAHVNEISDAIRERGMNNLLADRIKDFLDRLVRDHGSIDLEWLRDAPPDKAKDYLLSIRGLGLKSVECVRLLTLHHLAFPVDTNVGRIAVRLGWVPLQPLPESLQLHLLEMYPVLESIQKYLWPRLCKLDQLTLYELHYQMITFGKVFCTKSKPNCNACPMKGECRHFASAFASARLSLPGPEEKRVVPSNTPNATHTTTAPIINNRMQLPPTEYNNNGRQISCQPIIEEPKTPEPEPAELLSISDIEDQYYEDDDEIPIIELDMKEFTTNLQKMQESMEIQGDMSKALVALNPRAASLPTQKLKNVSRLRTEHQVYEIPDTHPILQGLYKRESDDPSPYLLAIWTPGETATSMQPPERGCQAQESGMLCDRTTCFSCNCIKEANSQVVRGTILMPCRTAMRGSFPLNGTYFQVNEMFADHASSLSPIEVPRAWIWSLPRRTVYFGTSVSTIFKGLTTQEIQQCFWRGFVCVRGFDQKLRAPRPLMARLHFPASKLVNNNKTKNEDK